MADYIAKVQTIHGELKELGIVFPEEASAAALLIDLTPAYEVTRKMLLTLSAKDLTFTKVSSALLSAKKDTTSQAKAYALRAPVPQASVASVPVQRKRFPPCTYVVKYGNCKGQTWSFTVRELLDGLRRAAGITVVLPSTRGARRPSSAGQVDEVVVDLQKPVTGLEPSIRELDSCS
ncbi:unnamed protein product [Closterium sp. NIES-53]